MILLKMRRERQTELNPKIVTVASNHATVGVGMLFRGHNRIKKRNDLLYRREKAPRPLLILGGPKIGPYLS